MIDRGVESGWREKERWIESRERESERESEKERE